MVNDTKTRSRGTTAPWQADAWTMYDAIGFLGAAYRYQADQVARVQFFPALLQPGGDQPVPLDALLNREPGFEEIDIPPGLTPSVVDLSNQLLRECRAKEGGLPETRRQMLLNLRVPGECYGLWTTDPQGVTTCEILSTDEVRFRGGKWELVGADGRGTPIDLSTQMLARIWRRHPRRKEQADSAMKALLGPCQEFLNLSAGNRAILLSRIVSAGMVLMANDIDFGPTDETDNDPQGRGASFSDTLYEAWMAGIRDPESVSAVAPMILQFDPGSGPVTDKIHHQTFDRPMRETELRRGVELVVEIVRGMDVIPESVFGLGEAATYATGRMITEENYLGYMDPPVLTMADALTTVWYRPGLLDAGVNPVLVEQLCFYRDPSQIIAHPDMAKNAVDGKKLGVVGDAATRRALGFSETDAPTDEEMAAFQERNTRAALPEGGMGDGPNSGDRNLTAAAPPLAIETTAREVTQTQRAFDSLSRRLADLDRSLMTRMQVAAEHSVERTLRTVGARLRSKAQGNPAARPLLDRIDNLNVGQALGAGMVAQLGVDLTSEIGPDSFSDLGADFDQWVRGAQRRSLDLIGSAGGSAGGTFDRDAIEERQDDDRRDGWAALVAALITLTRDRVLHPATDLIPQGEFDPSSNVPMSAIRQGLAVAGGSGGPAVIDGAPVGMVGTGPLVRETVTDVLLAEVTGYLWLTGEPLHPFEPHQDLDGVSFTSWTDDVLINDLSWPEFPWFFPSDHPGCVCSTVILYGERGSA